MDIKDCKEPLELQHPQADVTPVVDVAHGNVDKSTEEMNCEPKSPLKQENVWSRRCVQSPAIQEGALPNQPKPVSFSSIMSEQITESEQRKADDERSARVKFCKDIESEEERMMRLAIEASLRDQQHDNCQIEPRKSALKSGGGNLKLADNHTSSSLKIGTSISFGDDDMDQDMKQAIALSLEESGGNKKPFNLDADEDKKPSANGKKKSPSPYHLEQVFVENTPNSDHIETSPYAVAPSDVEPEIDESEQLARDLYDAELAASAAAEEASLQLAMMLQKEEEDRLRNNLGHDHYSEAARLKREEMCHGGGRGGGGADIGVRTVNREEFTKMKSGAQAFDGTTLEKRKIEESGMGKFLQSSKQFDEEEDDLPRINSIFDYTANERAVDYEDEYELYEDEGIRMNPQSGKGVKSSWTRLDKNTFIGSNNEIRTKHDTELVKSANAAKLKDAYSVGSSSVSGSTYNAFKRAEARQSGMKKGVAKQGHGRAENMNTAKTRGGAMDGKVRLQIAAAINQGLIERCNGVVKEGKEALIYHAEGKVGQRTDHCELDIVDSGGYDVAVKERGSYVDGDPRFHKQKFKTNDQREQLYLWTEKEYRNLLRAYRGGVKVPMVLKQKENVLFMRFLGENGWPSPQLREIEIKKGSEKWTALYCQTIAAIRRLYHCSRLVHADLSEYNILLCPSWQLSHDPIRPEDERTEEDQSLVVVLIDFGQAVEREHPNAGDLLRRDIHNVREFFEKQGIQTLSVNDAEKFVLATFSADNENKTTPIIDNDCEWRHNVTGWDDQKVIDDLLIKLQSHKK
eukprot:scaffold2638_cov66-Cyclotella_meneghiniana.AAC.7